MPATSIIDKPRARRAYQRARSHMGAGSLPKALACFRLASQFDPALAPAFLGEAMVCMESGLHLEAARALARCLELGAADAEVASALVRSLQELPVDARHADDIRTWTLQALARDDVRRSSLARTAGDLLSHYFRHRPDVPWWQLAQDPLFVATLSGTYLTRVPVEVWVTGLRRRLLGEALEAGRLTEEQRVVAASIALTAFHGEYLLDVGPLELEALGAVRELMSGLTYTPGSAAVWSDLVLLRACYEPMADWEQALALVQLPPTCLGPSLARLIDTTLRPVLDERERAHHVRSLTEVQDVTSQAVRAQYERNPYPRWLTLRRLRPVPYAARVSLQDVVKPWHDAPGAHVLVAGCGTGRRALQVAQAHPQARVFAVDLSRRSLSYAQRMGEHHDVRNVRFAHADLLELGQTDLAFEVVECVDVLHHLREPVAGLRSLADVLVPGGLLRLDVYSRTARRDLTIGQRWVKSRRWTGELDELRAFRRAVIAGQLGPEVQLALSSLDFYSASGVRDLFFQVQEHQYDWSELHELARAAGLEVVGVDDGRPELAQRWAQVHRRPVDWSDLHAWSQVEAAFPLLFINRYPLWLRRPE